MRPIWMAQLRGRVARPPCGGGHRRPHHRRTKTPGRSGWRTPRRPSSRRRHGSGCHRWTGSRGASDRASRPFAPPARPRHRGDWAGVVVACSQALAADPGHLRRPGLRRWPSRSSASSTRSRAARARRRRGFRQVGDRLARPARAAAVSGDTAGRRGGAGSRPIARPTPRRSRARSAIAAGDLYAVDPGGPRWYRLTRTRRRDRRVRVTRWSPLAYVSRTRKKATAIPPQSRSASSISAPGTRVARSSSRPDRSRSRTSPRSRRGSGSGSGSSARVLDASGIATATKRAPPARRRSGERTRTGRDPRPSAAGAEHRRRLGRSVARERDPDRAPRIASSRCRARG